MKRVLMTILALGLLLQGTNPLAFAQGAKPHVPFMVYGPVKGTTTVSCGAFVASKSPERQVYEWWFAGFVSGAGHVLSEDAIALSITDAEGINGWVAKYCADHPLDDMEAAAAAVVVELRARAEKK